VADVFRFSTKLDFDTNMSEKPKSMSLSGVQVKNWLRTVRTEEKLDVIR